MVSDKGRRYNRIIHEPPVTLISLTNTNIQHKQINYDADNIDNNE